MEELKGRVSVDIPKDTVFNHFGAIVGQRITPFPSHIEDKSVTGEGYFGVGATLRDCGGGDEAQVARVI